MVDRLHLQAVLRERERDQLLRVLTPSASQPGPVALRGPRELHNFVSNNYLDLASHPEIALAASLALERWGCGSTGSRLLGGDLQIHHDLERDLALFKSTPAALFFNTGYMANLGVMTSLASSTTLVFADRLIHASILDGIRLSGARLHRFRHNDPADLRKLLQTHRGPSLIVAESVYSMDGDLAPLAELCDLADEFSATLVIDEAHADGVFGPGGRGRVTECGLEARVDVIVGTFGKAYGCAGAAVWCCAELKDWMVNSCRPFLFSTALPPSVPASVAKSIEVSQRESWRRDTVLQRARHLRDALRTQGFDLGQSESQIVPILLGTNERALGAARWLESHADIWAAAIRHPTVPQGQARLRINLSAGHSDATVDHLIESLVQWRGKEA